MKQKLQKGDKIPFTQVANVVLNDTNISFKAKGLYGYLYSKDDTYDFAAKRIAKDSSDGLDSVLAGLKELEMGGYILRHKLKSGRVAYTIHIEKAKTAKPHSGQKPKRENPNKGNSLDGKILSISNIDAETNIDKKQTFSFGKKNRVKEMLETLAPLYEEKWDSADGNREEILKALRVKLMRGSELHTRVPLLIATYLDAKDEGHWKTKQDFMATMRNLTKAIVDAEVDTVSVSAWNDAISKTELMDMATINTVIKLI